MKGSSEDVIEARGTGRTKPKARASNVVHKDLPPNQPYRTAYHFQPPKNWMNGPMIYKGIYHLFYQYNPQGPVWGNITWAHSTSKDLVNWTPQPIALNPTSQQSDINGCWTGSATILPEWIKSPNNPLISPSIENKIDPNSFRDPTTSWLGHDGLWRVIVGNENEHRGMALLYRSKDFVHWTKAKEPLFSTEGSVMWECPDFYPVFSTSKDGVDTSMVGNGIKHVLKASLSDGSFDSYAIGRYDIEKDVFVSEKGSLKIGSELRYDYGKFYASKTFFDSSTKRRILWAWISESTNKSVDIMKGWSGLQGIPRKIWLDKSGKQLMQWPVAEIEKLRTNKVISPSIVLKEGSVHEVLGVTASQVILLLHV
ncbi:Fructan beta-(2,6)-fructosidase [Handroanthus impetiginosus]|uniref:Fructan beta-(2,6)-fructosidase n=1 Tax=Handroanthus impetiginosus TaxID=429701 RepID=A0A2G9HXP3_9LAMI|nr:Fructan beta-(2,6)-fructosidase [Handroanthus impetiginosus]